MASPEDHHDLRTFGGGEIDDVPGRFSAESALSGDIAEAEHLARYAWVSQLAGGRRVLDAGCGWAYGTGLLADAGATEAVGVDLAPTVIEVAQRELGDRVALHVGDLRALPFPDASFDMVVCFEVIEHVHERAAVIGELRRVLVQDGLLVISSPNRERSVPGNPYHVHEYTPSEFAAELSAAFANLRVDEQHNWLVSAVTSAEVAARGGLEAIAHVRLLKGVVHARGEEDYMVAIASDGPLPEPVPPLGVATSDVELRRWVSLYAEQSEALRRQHEYLESLDLEGMKALAVEFERVAATEASLVARVAELESDLSEERDQGAAERDQVAAMQAELDRRDMLLARADRVREDVFNSVSWRVTTPLRVLKRARG